MTSPISSRRRFCPPPAWLIFGLLVVEGLLWLSERYQWFWFNEKKGWTVLIGVGAVGVAIGMMLLWFAVSMIFRWRFRFSIWSLLVLVVAVAIPSSWLGVEMKEANRQRNLVDKVRKSACLVGRDWEFDSKGDYIQNAHLPEPDWLLNLLGEDFFDTVVIVELTSDATDATLVNVKGLVSLKHLWLNGTLVTEAGLGQLRDLTQLQELSLLDTKIGNTGLDRLNGFTKLQELWLCGTHVTDVGLERLVGLSQLTILWLDSTQITDIGLEHLSGMKQLRELSLCNTKVTKAGVKKLQKELPNCKVGSDFDQTSESDDGN